MECLFLAFVFALYRMLGKVNSVSHEKRQDLVVVHLRRRLNMRYKRCVMSLFLLTLELCRSVPVSGDVLSNSTCILQNIGSIASTDPPPNPGPWEILTSLVFPLIVLVIGTIISGLILDYLREWRRKQKDGDFGTPVVIKQHL